MATDPGRCRAAAALLALGSMATSMPASAQEDAGFDVNIVLSEKAAATLAARGEGMVIMVSYYGWPKPSAKKHGDEVGQIGFGPDRQIEIPGKAGQYHVPAVKLDPQRLGWLEGPVQVNVNIASARRSDPDNLLDCEIIDGPLAEARKATRTLPCRLIGDDPAPPKTP